MLLFIQSLKQLDQDCVGVVWSGMTLRFCNWIPTHFKLVRRAQKKGNISILIYININ